MVKPENFYIKFDEKCKRHGESGMGREGINWGHFTGGNLASLFLRIPPNISPFAEIGMFLPSGYQEGISHKMNKWSASGDPGEAREPSLPLPFLRSFIWHNHYTQVPSVRAVGSESPQRWHKVTRHAWRPWTTPINILNPPQCSPSPPRESTKRYPSLGMGNGSLGLQLCCSPSWEVLQKPTPTTFQRHNA